MLRTGWVLCSEHRTTIRFETIVALRSSSSWTTPFSDSNWSAFSTIDTAQALFDVANYMEFVEIQIESAVRAIGARYAYDDIEHKEITLRGDAEVVSEELEKELQERCIRAGITIDECRLTHLAYASEIAQAMLRRQQAEAVIAARSKIVIGAVSMVENAIQLLSEKGVVHLDDERKATMVSNLMVVLCSDREAQPVVNAGTLYQ